ncbi:21413_t:CDS:2, partial [Entrophospora sp. SA101]
MYLTQYISGQLCGNEINEINQHSNRKSSPTIRIGVTEKFPIPFSKCISIPIRNGMLLKILNIVEKRTSWV